MDDQQKPTPVPALNPESKEEQRRFNEPYIRRQHRLEHQKIIETYRQKKS